MPHSPSVTPDRGLPHKRPRIDHGGQCTESKSESRLSLLDLPRELRDRIYAYSLFSEEVIYVLRMTFISTSEYDPGLGHYEPGKDYPRESISDLAMGLLRTNRQISEEAALVFYGTNEFSMVGSEIDFARVSDWLEQIGPRNRTAMTVLQLQVREMSRAWQFADGSREGLPDDWISKDDVYPRIPYLKCPDVDEEGIEHWEEGEVEAIDPKFEDIFRVLGKDEKTTNGLSIYLSCDGGDNFNVVDSCHTASLSKQYWASMDLPNVVEKWRELHTSGRRQVDVVWMLGTNLEDPVTYFEGLGFDIVGLEDYTELWKSDESEYRRNTLRLRRRPIVADIVASGPNPWRAGTPGPQDAYDYD